MNNVQIELDSAGIQELLKSEEVQQCLTEQAEAIIGRCEGNYETDVHVGKKRANVAIKTTDEHTYWKNLADNELLRALK